MSVEEMDSTVDMGGQDSAVSCMDDRVRADREETERRGPIVVVMFLGSVSVLVAAAAAVLWLWQHADDGGGYNSMVSAVVASGHGGLAGGCILLSRFLHRGRQNAAISSDRWLVATFLFISGLVYLELAAGMVVARVPIRATPYESAPLVGWRMRSDFQGRYGGVALQTNNEGFRSATLSLKKPQGAARVICLGDSLTFGHCLEEPFTYPRQLERVLGERFPARSWEVVNTGVEGYSTFQATQQLRRSLSYDPDLAVLLFCLNDVTEKYTALRSFGGTGFGYQGVADGAASRVFQALVSLRGYSALITALTPREVDAQRREAYSVEKLWQEPDAPHIGQAWEQAEKELDELVDLCRERKLGLLLAVAPYSTQFGSESGLSAPQDRLRRYAQMHDVAFLDLKPPLTKAALDGRIPPKDFYLDACHFNSTGCRVIAEVIAERFNGSAVGSTEAAGSWDEAAARAIGVVRADTH